MLPRKCVPRTLPSTQMGPLEGQEISHFGVPKTLVAAVGSKMSQNGIFSNFSRHVKYASHDSNAVIDPQEKTWKNVGKMSIFVTEAMRESAMWHFEEVLEGLLEPSVGSNSHQSASRFFQKTVSFIETFCMWDFARLTPHHSWYWLRVDAMCKDLDRRLHTLNLLFLKPLILHWFYKHFWPPGMAKRAL